MNDKEIRELAKRLKEYHLKLREDKEAAKAFFVEAGIITPKGDLTPQYKNLCIPHEQA